MKHIVHKEWERKHTIPTSKIPSNLCSWLCFISSVGAFLLPQLAEFYFPSWRIFIIKARP